MQTFNIRVNDTLPSIKVQVKHGTVGSMAALDLTGYTATFDLINDAGTKVVDGAAATITDPTNGKVQYDWASGDTATAGTYNAQFNLTRTADSKVMTVPNRVEDELWVEIRSE